MVVTSAEAPLVEPVPAELKRIPRKAKALPSRALTAREWERVATENGVGLNACVDQIQALVLFVEKRDVGLTGDGGRR